MVTAITMTYVEEAIGVARARPARRPAGRHLLHAGDRRAAPERPDAGRGDRAVRLGDRRRARLLHDQLRPPDPLRGRAGRRAVARAHPRPARERLHPLARRARRGDRARRGRPDRPRRPLRRPHRRAAAAERARRLLRHRPSPRRGDRRSACVRDQEIRFCSTPAGRIAYATVGSGPPLVVPALWVGHLEREWEFPEYRAFIARARAHADGDPLRPARHRPVGPRRRRRGAIRASRRSSALVDTLDLRRVLAARHVVGRPRPPSRSRRGTRGACGRSRSSAPSRTGRRSLRARCARRSSPPCARTGARARARCSDVWLPGADADLRDALRAAPARGGERRGRGRDARGDLRDGHPRARGHGPGAGARRSTAATTTRSRTRSAASWPRALPEARFVALDGDAPPAVARRQRRGARGRRRVPRAPRPAARRRAGGPARRGRAAHRTRAPRPRRPQSRAPTAPRRPPAAAAPPPASPRAAASPAAAPRRRAARRPSATASARCSGSSPRA